MAPTEHGAEALDLRELLRSSGYRRLLLLAALTGIPVSLAAFGFVTLQHALQHWLWQSLPGTLGYASAPWWWPLPSLALGGVLVGLAIALLPGRGGHVPARGLGGPTITPGSLPGVLAAALAGLSLGTVLGPEAPLMALGSGLALLAVRSARREAGPRLTPVLGAAGSAAAISTIFGSPLVAGILLIEASGIGGAQLFALILPCLLASGVGALVFTGFGDWTGLATGKLALPLSVPDGPLDAGDFLWGVPVAALAASFVCVLIRLGGRIADRTEGAAGRAAGNGDRAGGRGNGNRGRNGTVVRTVVCALAVGACLTAYALATGRSPEEAALSGQATLAELAAHPYSWPVSALVLLVLFKGIAYGISLGSLRGGPIFPSLLLGAALATACSGLPGFGVVPAMAAGISAAGTAAMRLPLSAIVLTALLLGGKGTDQIPLVIISSVVAFVVGELLRGRWEERDEAPAPGP